jgi:hypothetical protein
MKRFFLLITATFVFVSVSAQMKDFSYKFYGRVRTDVFYNSRHNVESVEGAFFMYPKDVQLDPNGEDLNAVSNSGDFIFCTRLGLDITGPMLFNAKTTAKIETDFGGFSTSVLGNFYYAAYKTCLCEPGLGTLFSVGGTDLASFVR